MHWSRWGDPAEAGPLPEATRALVELGLRPARRAAPAVADVSAAAEPALGRRRARAAARRWSAPSTCSPTTSPASVTPAGSRPPTCCGCGPATARDAPDAVVRPADHDEVAALLAVCSEHQVARRAVRRRHLRGRRPGGPPRRLRRRRSLDLRRLDRLVSVDPSPMTAVLEAGSARSRGRGAARRARPDARPLPAVVRVRLDRRLRRHPLQRPGLVRLRPLRRAWSSAYRRHPDRRPRPRQRARQRGRPGPARSSCSAPRARSA